MRVLVNALSARVGGGLSYIGQQLEALVRVRPDWAVSILAAPWNEEAVRSLADGHVRPVSVHSLFQRLAFEQVVLPLQLRDFDVVYCPGNFMPLAARTPCVVAEQNANYFGRGRELVSRMSARMQLEILLARLSIKKASAVLVISQSLREDMERDGLWTNKCRVILHGAPVLALRSEKPPRPELYNRFLLSLANDYPHKRLDDLVRAWTQLQWTDPPSLVFAGSISTRRIEHHRSLVSPDRRSRLFHLGSINSRSQIRWLLENALALVITSAVEAFPLTPAEAGEVGCPLVLTDIPPHREVTQNRGSYYEVGRVDELTQRLDEQLEDPSPRHPWQWPITWEQNADELATLLETAVDSPRSRPK